MVRDSRLDGRRVGLVNMDNRLDELARNVVKCANDNLILRNSSYEQDEELYSAIVLLAELLDEPIYNNWSLA